MSGKQNGEPRVARRSNLSLSRRAGDTSPGIPLYAPLATFPQYTRFENGKVCQCFDYGSDEYGRPCKVKFQSVDALELTAEEWDHYSKIREAVPHATFQLREHRAQCLSAAPLM